jgi:hypothetical protein
VTEDEERRIAQAAADADRQLRPDDRFEEADEEVAEGVTEVIFGEWIPGARRPKETDD